MMLDVRALARVLCPVAALLLSGCLSEADGESSPPTPSVAGSGGSNAGSGGTGSAGTGVMGGTTSVPQPVEPKTTAERCAELDALLAVPRPEGWTVDSHCKEATPDYGAVFGSEIKRLDIVVTADVQAAMEQDLADLQNGGGGGPGPQPEDPCDGRNPGDSCQDWNGTGVCTDLFGSLICYSAPPVALTDACRNKAENEACTVGTSDGQCSSDGITVFCWVSQPPNDPSGSDTCNADMAGDACKLGGREGAGVCTQSGRLLSCQGALDKPAEPDEPLDAAAAFWPRDPKYFEAKLRFGEHEWLHVGYRYKGNNGLSSAVGNKRPFRLKLDELEKDFPEITDQRFFGFKELSFSPGGSTDPTFVHQVLTAEMFGRAGVPTPRSSLVSVYLDQGKGPELLGVYAMTEVPADPFTKRTFDDKNGCLYKPDGLGARLMAFHPESSHPKSEACPADQADIQRLVSALNAEITDRKLWRERLGQAIDLPGLVRFFAANEANDNWDTYGGLAHNYFLYGKSGGGPLHFVPWDFDLSMAASSNSDFSLDAYGGDWPLLQAVARDAELYSAYHVALDEVTAREYEGGLLVKRVTEVSAQLRPLLADEGVDVADWESQITQLKSDIEDASKALRSYLDSRGF